MAAWFFYGFAKARRPMCLLQVVMCPMLIKSKNHTSPKAGTHMIDVCVKAH